PISLIGSLYKVIAKVLANRLVTVLDDIVDEIQSTFGRSIPPVVQESPDESSAEETLLIKRKYVKKRQPAKKNDKNVNESWTPDEEAAVCKSWINTYENNKDENGKKTNGFWMAVTAYFHKETRSTKRSHESVNCKWKNRICPKAKYLGSKKSRTSESAPNSAHSGLNLNEEAAGSVDEEIKESRPVGQDKTKRM
nr:transposon TX1 putative 149 kDa protein [Tanacetum cinerariifolium]